MKTPDRSRPILGRSVRRRWLPLALVAALSALLLAGCALFSNTPPVAQAAADRTTGRAPLGVSFDASASADIDGRIVSFRWAFGDGATGRGPVVDHVFTAPGTYRVTLTVLDDRRARGTASVDIVARGENAPPVAAFTVSPSPAYPDQIVRFDATPSYDPDGEIVSYDWEFGDAATASGELASHRFPSLGTVEIALTVHDNDGEADRVTAQLVIATDGAIPGVLTLDYDWTYDGRARSCRLTVPRSLYAYYRSQPRVAWAVRDYDEYVLDPLDDPYLNVVAEEISESDDDYHAIVENALYFVQHCIRYVYDPAWFEYPRYPIETLVDGVGDCEDTAILYASLVRTLGHGALLVAVDTDGNGIADHMVVFVPVERAFAERHPDRSFWEYAGGLYAFAETAVEGGYVPLGVDPWGLTEDRVKTIYDVSRVDRTPAASRRAPAVEP